MKFRTTVVQTGKTATGIRVPPDVVSSLSTSERPAVRVTINEYTYRSTVAPMGGEFWLPVSAEVRERAGAVGGDAVEIGIELDTEPRAVTVPPDLDEALQRDSAQERFAALSSSNQRRIVLQVEDAKTAEARQRRIAKAVASLPAGSST